MRRGVILVLAVLLTGLALSACGGGGGGGGSNATDATDAQYVDALTASIMAAEDTPKSVDEADARCIAKAIVGVYGAGAFEDAKLSVKDARDPKTDLGALSGPSEDQAKRIGLAVQACKVGDSFAASFVQGMNANKSGEACLAKRLNTDRSVAPFLGATMVTQKDMSQRDASALVDVFVECVDLGTALMAQSGLKWTAAETACLNTELEHTDVFKKLVTRLVVGENVNESDLGAATSPAINKCVTPERRTALGITGG